MELGCQAAEQKPLPPASASNLKGAFRSAEPMPELIYLGKLATGFYILVFQLPRRKLMSVNAFTPIVPI